MDHPVFARALYASASSVYNLGNGSVVVPEDECYCAAWLASKGSKLEKKIANALQWFAFAFSVILLMYYAYATWRTTCGWEEVYVCCVETTKVVIEFFHEFDEPAMLLLANGNRVQWLRYGEWLLTCPVILIHLSNLTGLKDDYSKRTMRLLVSDIGTIVWGATAAMSKNYVRVIFFLLGCAYGGNTFFHAAKVYIESFHTVPKGLCRHIVRAMAWLFFISWGMFPVLFLLGPEGFGHLSVYGSTIGHTIIDVMSKNVWGLLGHFLRLKIHEHILLHGDIRKMTKIKVAGEELEVETLVAEEDENTVKRATGKYAARESFLVMRDKLKEKGFEVRASLENSAGVDTVTGDVLLHNGLGGGGGKAGTELSKLSGQGGDANALMSSITPGRVILAVPDISMVEFFREQFVQVPVAYEVVPALGADNTIQLVQQAMGLGGCDFVLLHPEFLRDKNPSSSLVARLRALGQRVAAFGWAPLGPVRDLIEESGLDGWLEGPSFGSGVSLTNLVALIARMQQAKKLGMMVSMASGGSMLMMKGSGSGIMMSGGNMAGPGAGMGVGMGVGMNGSMIGMGMGVGMNGGGGMMANGGVTSQNMSSGMMANGGMAHNMSMMGGGGLGGGGMGSVPGTPNGMVANGMALQQQQQFLQQQLQQMNSGGGMGGSPGTFQGQMNGSMMGNGMGAAQTYTSGRVGTNPLFNTAPSPLNSQPGEGTPAAGGGGGGGNGSGMTGGSPAVMASPPSMSGPGGSPATAIMSGTAFPMAAAGGGGASGAVSETEMLQQLMAEINRLKSELGEQH